LNITFIEYYSKNYAIVIRDESQPLLVARDRATEKVIYLIPELCKMTGLDRKSKNDNRLMGKIAKYTRLDPQQRYNYISELTQQIVSKTEKNLNQWGIKISETNPYVDAVNLTTPRIRIGKKKEVDIKKGTFNIRDQIYEKGVVEDWVVFYSENNKRRDGKLADELAYQLRQIGK